MIKLTCNSFAIAIISTMLFIGCSKNNDKLSSNQLEKEKPDSDTNQFADSNEFNFNENLWISFNNKLEEKVSFKKYHGKNVIIKGKFNYGNGKGGYGHFNLWNGEITEISAIEILKNQNRNKYLDVNELINNSSKYNGKIVSVYGNVIFGMENFEIRPINVVDSKK